MKDREDKPVNSRRNVDPRGALGDHMLYFLRQNPVLVIGTWILMIAVWGTWMSHDIVTFDAEGLYTSADSAIWYAQWRALGRPALLLGKWLLGVLNINPYFSNTILFICFPLSAILCAVFIEQCAEEDLGLWKLLFTAFYICHPIWALMFSYRMHMEVLAIAMVLLPVGIMKMLSWLKTGNLGDGLISFVLIVICFASFQSFMILYADMCAVYLFFCVKREPVRMVLNKSVRILAFTAAAFFAWFEISWISGLNLNEDYAVSKFQWSSGTLSDGLKRITAYVGKTMFGNGYEYSAVYGIVSIAFLAGCLIYVLFQKKKVLVLLTGICIWIFPYLLVFLTAGEIPSRSQYAFVFSCAFMLLWDVKWICSAWKKNRRWIGTIVFACVLFLVLPEMQRTTRLLYTDVQTMQRDHQIFQSIYDRAMAEGACPGDALYIHGGRPNFIDETFLETEVVGFSYFEFTGMSPDGFLKAVQAMRAYGYEVCVPDEQQRITGETIAQELSCWPEKGSLRVLPEEHLIVVNMEAAELS